MEIVKSNQESRVHKQFLRKQDTKAFNYRDDDSLPNFAFRKERLYPLTERLTNNRERVKYNLEDHGSLGKMFLKHNITGLANTTTSTFKDNIGANIIESARIIQNGKELEFINSLAIVQRINETISTNLHNILVTAVTINKDSPTSIECYTPLLFSIGKDINRWLDTKFLKGCQLEVIYRAVSSITNDANASSASHASELWCDYAVIDDYESFAKNEYPVDVSVENVYHEPDAVISSTGDNTIRLKCGQLVHRSYLSFETDNIAGEGQVINSVELTANDQRLYFSGSYLESVLLNHNYIGVDSDAVPDATSTAWTLQWGISSSKNGNYGSLNMRGLHKDLKLIVNTSQTGRLKIAHVYHEKLHIDNDGNIGRKILNQDHVNDKWV